MKKIMLLVFLAVAMQGCISESAIFPKVTDRPFLKPSDAGYSVRLADMKDNRSSEKAGRISGLGIKAGDELTRYIYSRLRNRLIEKNISIQLISAMQGESISSPSHLKAVVPSLESASIKTADSVMFPAKSEISLKIEVCDSSGKVFFSKVYTGNHSDYLGLVFSGKLPGEYMSIAADRAVESVAEDPEFLKAIQ